jgi:hypothetical protein
MIKILRSFFELILSKIKINLFQSTFFLLYTFCFNRIKLFFFRINELELFKENDINLTKQVNSIQSEDVHQTSKILDKGNFYLRDKSFFFNFNQKNIFSFRKLLFYFLLKRRQYFRVKIFLKYKNSKHFLFKEAVFNNFFNLKRINLNAAIIEKIKTNYNSRGIVFFFLRTLFFFFLKLKTNFSKLLTEFQIIRLSLFSYDFLKKFEHDIIVFAKQNLSYKALFNNKLHSIFFYRRIYKKKNFLYTKSLFYSTKKNLNNIFVLNFLFKNYDVLNIKTFKKENSSIYFDNRKVLHYFNLIFLRILNFIFFILRDLLIFKFLFFLVKFIYIFFFILKATNLYIFLRKFIFSFFCFVYFFFSKPVFYLSFFFKVFYDFFFKYSLIEKSLNLQPIFKFFFLGNLNKFFLDDSFIDKLILFEKKLKLKNTSSVFNAMFFIRKNKMYTYNKFNLNQLDFVFKNLPNKGLQKDYLNFTFSNFLKKDYDKLFSSFDVEFILNFFNEFFSSITKYKVFILFFNFELRKNLFKNLFYFDSLYLNYKFSFSFKVFNFIYFYFLNFYISISYFIFKNKYIFFIKKYIYLRNLAFLNVLAIINSMRKDLRLRHEFLSKSFNHLNLEKEKEFNFNKSKKTLKKNSLTLLLNNNAFYYLKLKNFLQEQKSNEIFLKYDYLNHLSLNKQLFRIHLVNKNIQQIRQELQLKHKILNSFDNKNVIGLKKNWLNHLNYFFNKQLKEEQHKSYKKNIFESVYLKHLFFNEASKNFFSYVKLKKLDTFTNSENTNAFFSNLSDLRFEKGLMNFFNNISKLNLFNFFNQSDFFLTLKKKLLLKRHFKLQNFYWSKHFQDFIFFFKYFLSKRDRLWYKSYMEDLLKNNLLQDNDLSWELNFDLNERLIIDLANKNLYVKTNRTNLHLDYLKLSNFFSLIKLRDYLIFIFYFTLTVSLIIFFLIIFLTIKLFFLENNFFCLLLSFVILFIFLPLLVFLLFEIFIKFYKLNKLAIKLSYYKPVKFTIINFFFNTGIFYFLRKFCFLTNFEDAINYFSLKGTVLRFKINYLKLKKTNLILEIIFLILNIFIFLILYSVIYNILISLFIFFFFRKLVLAFLIINFKDNSNFFYKIIFIKFNVFIPVLIINIFKINFGEILNFFFTINKINICYNELGEFFRYLRNTKIVNFEQKLELLKKIMNFKSIK